MASFSGLITTARVLRLTCAAMLMARYSELIGRPRKIKQILCESATDLGRERSFQGHGMLDVLRAFQTI